MVGDSVTFLVSPVKSTTRLGFCSSSESELTVIVPFGPSLRPLVSALDLFRSVLPVLASFLNFRAETRAACLAVVLVLVPAVASIWTSSEKDT